MGKIKLAFDDFRLSEALYYFVTECHDADFCRSCFEEDISIAEWVFKYQLEEFKRYALNTFNIEVVA